MRCEWPAKHAEAAKFPAPFRAFRVFRGQEIQCGDLRRGLRLIVVLFQGGAIQSSPTLQRAKPPGVSLWATPPSACTFSSGSLCGLKPCDYFAPRPLRPRRWRRWRRWWRRCCARRCRDGGLALFADGVQRRSACEAREFRHLRGHEHARRDRSRHRTTAAGAMGGNPPLVGKPCTKGRVRPACGLDGKPCGDTATPRRNTARRGGGDGSPRGSAGLTVSSGDFCRHQLPPFAGRKRL